MRRIELAIIALIIYIHIVAWFTPIAVVSCFFTRSYFAIGGEWFGLFTVPFALYGICKLYLSTLEIGGRKSEIH